MFLIKSKEYWISWQLWNENKCVNEYLIKLPGNKSKQKWMIQTKNFLACLLVLVFSMNTKDCLESSNGPTEKLFESFKNEDIT